jgi:hypothetical protein
VLVGILGGALFGSVIAAAIPSTLVGAVLLLGDVHPVDRAHDVERFPAQVAICGVGGIVVGALAGLASRLPTSGLPFLRCCIFIAITAGVVRLLTAPQRKVSETDQYYLSYIASGIAAVAMTGTLIGIGLRRGHSCRHGTSGPSARILRRALGARYAGW